MLWVVAWRCSAAAPAVAAAAQWRGGTRLVKGVVGQALSPVSASSALGFAARSRTSTDASIATRLADRPRVGVASGQSRA
jgi:hypothetical protein